MLTTDSMIRVEGLVKVFGGGPFKKGFRALDGVSLEVGGGSVFGLLGPNGAGKTTLIKILLGLARKTKGTAELFGMPAGQAEPRQRVGYLPEAHRLPGYLTGRQVIELFGMMCGRDLRFIRERAPRMIDLVGMTRDADRKIREYSKGMQQRIGLAQAMIHEPEVIFLDEPTDGVDPVGRAAIREVVLELKREGKTIFINSHLLNEVELISDRIVIMHRGKIIREGTLEELTPRTGLTRFDVEPMPADPTTLQATIGGIGAGFETTETGFQVLLTPEELDLTVDRLRAAKVSIRGMTAVRVNLEQAFIATMKDEDGGAR